MKSARSSGANYLPPFCRIPEWAWDKAVVYTSNVGWGGARRHEEMRGDAKGVKGTRLVFSTSVGVS